MGIFDKLKAEFIDIIEYLEESSNTLVYKFDRKIMKLRMVPS